MDYLEFIETTVFSRKRAELMKDDDFQAFQSYLLLNHHEGDTISHTGGCKKIRWGLDGKGKRGGVRVIYYLTAPSGRVYLLLIYSKNEKDDLSGQEKAILRSIVQQLD
ncbi:type II toxin-antitoxin system RelE/ParE family toxin [Serratia marcescens]|uniref:type II toxin-antitoxin system RelE/ParE family toxin n=1 Tax=Serratia TaxID=613 RepID=UPI001574B99D|nr:type II toxin-antitoxin system RelE/ParE family toxin [Serratia marcescens]ELY1863880.1 type II toxin-antitoxin system RelE/ParE family toxin [Serratia marcescens]MBI6132169.1 type II toxin-antitoxin system RelE/ParE family toxin [Serratia marcescens]MBN5322849.1 type II toxin-antitoxin system RelE/ParE family toxin [Serratia marcescens]MCA4113027.1 type II toxin-antitoxin system RelE/ParE family toxin [Serratia marcescens]MDN0030932.1 type II toxin-antitoxin system RelE/ParE family toxin [